MKNEKHAFAVMDRIKEAYQNILGGNLVGIYIHGSLAFGCFSWERSDIDFLVVIEHEPTHEEKIAIIRILVDLDAQCPQKGFEMSVVTADVCNPFVYPTPYVLHYSNTYKDTCRKDMNAFCRRMHGTDRDLAAHFTVTRAVGITLFGKPIPEVFGAVPAEDYLDSIRCDIENAAEDIDGNPVYFILNLCRVLAYVRDGIVLSKADGGAWGCANLPAEYVPLVHSAQNAYLGNTPLTDTHESGHRFAAYMLSEIFR